MTTGWSTRPLGQLCDILDNQRKPITKRDRTAGSYPYYGATGVQDYVSGYLFDEPLVLVGEDGAKWASGENTAFAVAGKCWVNNHAHVLRPDRSRILDSWLIYFLVQSDLSEFVSGLTVPKLNQSSLREIPIPLPPLPEQERIVGMLEEALAGLATAKANAEQNLRNARGLFESELQSVFTERGDGWGERPLGEIADFKNGLNFSKSSGGQKLPIVGVADFKDNTVVPLSQLGNATIDGTLAKGYALERGDILVVRSNGSKHLVGRSMLVGDVDKVISYSGFVIRIRFDISRVFPQFLLHFLKCQTTRRTLTSGGGGANITNINQSKLTSLPVPLPTYTEQVAIAKNLQHLQEDTQRLESTYRSKLAALGDLKKSLLHQAFTGALTTA